MANSTKITIKPVPSLEKAWSQLITSGKAPEKLRSSVVFIPEGLGLLIESVAAYKALNWLLSRTQHEDTTVELSELLRGMFLTPEHWAEAQQQLAEFGMLTGESPSFVFDSALFVDSFRRVCSFAETIFGSEEQAIAWLRAQHPDLEGQKPSRLLGQPGGQRRLLDILALTSISR